MIRVIIADDHAIVRQGLKQILSETNNISVTGEAETGLQAIKIVRENVFDVMLLDISLPDKSGIEVLKQIKKEQPRRMVLMLSMHTEHEFRETWSAAYHEPGHGWSPPRHELIIHKPRRALYPQPASIPAVYVNRS